VKQLKELFSDTLIYGISSVFARFINYLLVPLYTGVFDTDAYGVVGLVYAFITFLNVILTLGMESAYIRYGKDREVANSYFKSIQGFLVLSSMIILLILWLFQPIVNPLLGLEQSSPIFLMMLGILIFDTISIVPFAELRLIRKAKLFAVLKTGNVVINLSLNFYLILVLNYGIEAVFIGNLAASAITSVVVLFFTRGGLKGEWNQDYLKKALLFGLPFVPAGLGHAINETIDRFFLKGMEAAEVSSIYGAGLNADDLVGIYNACYKLAVFMLLIVQMFRMAWQPFFMRISDQEDAPRLFADTFIFFNVIAAAVFLGVSLFVEQIVAIKVPLLDAYLIGEEYWVGLSIVPILLIAYWFQGWYINFSAGIFIAEKTKRLAQITIAGALVTIISNLILIPMYGMTGAALATVMSYGVMAILIYRYSTRSFPVPYPIVQGFMIIGVAALAVYTKPFLSELNFSDIGASILLFVIAMVIIASLSFGRMLLLKKRSVNN
jgi:O-antigen/teichoic acid export membrane protein